MKYIVGIDPGLTGAMVLLSPSMFIVELRDIDVMANGLATGSVKTKVNAPSVHATLKLWKEHASGDVVVYMEEPDPMPSHENKFGKRIGMPAASSKSMGRSIGVFEGVCAALGLELHLVKPAAWKKAMNLPRDKEACRAKAIEWYPSEPLARKKDHNRAEAILIARYGMMQP